ncbi:MAG: hypothetical protein IKK47_00065 [Ruminococcus sp.]|nr:hypothetical protein [Ruminococcus sp.]
MSEQLKNLLILLAGIIVILLVVILLFSGKSTFRRFLSVFLDGQSSGGYDAGRRQTTVRTASENRDNNQKKSSGPVVEMATLIRKCDDRLRIIESTGKVEIKDARYELIFVTRKGRNVVIECSPEAYEKVPFNQQGSLTYKKNTLVKFKYYEDTVYN